MCDEDKVNENKNSETPPPIPDSEKPTFVLFYRNDEKHPWQMSPSCGSNLESLQTKLARQIKPKFVSVCEVFPE